MTHRLPQPVPKKSGVGSAVPRPLLVPEDMLDEAKAKFPLSYIEAVQEMPRTWTCPRCGEVQSQHLAHWCREDERAGLD